MKKILSLVIAFLLMSSVACAEVDVSSMSLDELQTLRSEVSSRIVELCRAQDPEIPADSLGTIAELFPDEPFAMAVRDKLGKLSISQSVTQEELDSIDSIKIMSSSSFGEVNSIEGIEHLRNLNGLYIVNYAAENMIELPTGFYQLINLTHVNLHGTRIQSLSPEIGNLVNLKSLQISGSELTGLPDELVNCTALKELDISYSNITEVPPVLFAMPNVKVSMEGTNVK